MQPFDPRQRAGEYLKRRLPRIAIVMPSPWWWAVLGLDSGVINIGSLVEFEPDESVAILVRPTPAREVSADERAIDSILRASGRPTFDAYRKPWRSTVAQNKFVGVCKAVRTSLDHDAAGHWWDGPVGLVTKEPLLFTSPAAARIAAKRPPGEIVTLPQEDRESIYHALMDKSVRP